MLRLFVAIELPEAVRDRIGALARPLPGAAWVRAASLHLTLAFIGEVDEGRAADIDIELARIALPAFALTVGGIGQFESRGRVRALWVGVEKAPELLALQAKVESALRRAGAEPEARRFLPHVTLARFRDVPMDRLAPFVSRHNGFRDGPFNVESFVLMSSRMGNNGSVYTPERRSPLLGAGIGALAEEWAARH